MTVNFTTNLGLAKPTADEIARLWVETDELELDNKQALNTYLTPVANGFQSYTPLVTSTSSLGSETERLGWFIRLPGDFIVGGFIIRLGSGASLGGVGDFLTITLPDGIDTAFHTTSSGTAGTGDIAGSAALRDNSTGSNSQTAAVELYQSTSMRFFTEDGASARWVTGTSVFTWDENDAISASFFYKAD